MAKFLIVEARFYDHLNDMLVAGAKAAIKAAGHKFEVVTVPGALEIPGAISLADASGDYDGYVAIGNGILTVENEAQALVRADPAQKDKGGEAAKAALALLALKERFGG
jgi:6,7-dimethyl-8-ribityllumazine synthase